MVQCRVQVPHSPHRTEHLNLIKLEFYNEENEVIEQEGEWEYSTQVRTATSKKPSPANGNSDRERAGRGEHDPPGGGTESDFEEFDAIDVRLTGTKTPRKFKLQVARRQWSPKEVSIKWRKDSADRAGWRHLDRVRDIRWKDDWESKTFGVPKLVE